MPRHDRTTLARTIAVPIALAVTLAACSSDDEGDSAALTSDPGRATSAPAGDEAMQAEPEAPELDRDDDELEAQTGFHPFIRPADDPLSTFAMDVDTASYTQARNWLDAGQLPPAETVRLEEWVNFHDYGDEAPAEGTWNITAEGGPSPLGEGRDLLRIGLHAREVADEARPDAVLTFVIDTSGSMQGGDRLGLVKRTLTLMLDNLRPTDQVGIVTYGSTASLLLRPTPIAEAEEIRRAIERLEASGSTFAEGGLRLGYEVAAAAQEPGATNTVVLLSDGVANVGETGPDAILAKIREEVDRGIRMSAVGVGMGEFNDVLLERLANNGDGQYWYVDDEREARRVFVDGLTGTLAPVADEAKVQVEFTDLVEEYRQLGYVNRALADEDFRNDDVDAGEVGAGHRISALYELVLADDVTGPERLATVTLRWAEPDSGEIVELARDITVDDLRRSGQRFALARAVVAGAEVLGGSPHTSLTRSDLADLVGVLDDLGPDAREFADLMRRAATL